MEKCLSEHGARDFLDDNVAASIREKIVVHVEDCERCQSLIEQLLERQTMVQSWGGSTKVGQTSNGRGLSILTDSIRHELDQARNEMRLPRGSLPNLSGFKIVKELGRGGSGVVFQAVQENLDRQVAVKIISGDLFGQTDLKLRFLREAKSVANLNHTNIARLHEISDSSEYGPLLVFEYVDAFSLEELIREHKKIDPKQAIEICRQIAAGAEHAHSHNLVHRDLKPSNILIDRDTETVKVIDFGLAVDPDQQSRLTMDSFIAGTPAYMSPEQIHSPKDLDLRSDLYSLGAVMFEMLTGDIPFRGLTKRTLFRVVEEEPPKLTTLNPDVPTDLETICLKLLNKSPQHRYQSMSELNDDLGRWQNGRPIHARPVSGIVRLQRWVERNPVVSALIAVVASLLILIAVGSTVGVLKLAKANELTQSAKESSDKAAKLAIQQRDQMLGIIDGLVYDINDYVDVEYVDQDELQIHLLTMAKDGLDEISTRESGEVNKRLGDINLRLATVHIRNSEYEQAEESLARVQYAADKLQAANPEGTEGQRLRLFSMWEEVDLLARKDQLASAEELMGRTVELEESVDVSSFSDNERSSLWIHKGYAKLNLAVLLLEANEQSEKIRSLMTEVFEQASRKSAQFLELKTMEMDNQQIEMLGLFQYAASCLADFFLETGAQSKVAEFDSRSTKIGEVLSIYDDGDRNPELMDEMRSNGESNAFTMLSSLKRTKQYYLYLLNEGDEDDDPSSLFFTANDHYRLGVLLAFERETDLAFEQYQLAVDMLDGLQTAPGISDLKIQFAAAGCYVRWCELAKQENRPFESQLEELNKRISTLSGLVEQEDDRRELRRIEYEIQRLGD